MLSLEDIGIGKRLPCFIVAEIGQNHQGDVEHAKELIQLAKKCGVNCVKFQKSSLRDRFTEKTLQCPYENPHAFGSSYGEHRSQLEFSEEEFSQLQDFAEKEVGIAFTASAMDIPSANFLMGRLNVPFVKIGSGDGNNFVLMEHIAKQKYPIVLSTGMQNLETVRQAHDLIMKNSQQLAILHCVSSYPTPVDDVNLSVLTKYRSLFPKAVIGYSGHEAGINVAFAAVALGAKIIERHFTKDKTQKGTDHKCSLDPPEMAAMVAGIREIERALGIPVKKILPSEIPCQEKLGKSIVTARKVQAGTNIELADLTVKVSRPMGLKPERIFEIIGTEVGENIEEDEPIILNKSGLIVIAK